VVSDSAELLHRVRETDPVAWLAWTLRKSGPARRLPAADRLALIERGIRSAADADEAFRGISVRDALASEKVPVADVEEPEPTAYPYLAVFDEATRSIDVNVRLLARLEEWWAGPDADPSLVVEARELAGRVTEVALAHELFHVHEAAHRPPQGRAGVFKRYRQLQLDESVAEVGAVAFSQAKAGLECSPVVFEFAIALMLDSPATVLRALQEVS